MTYTKPDVRVLGQAVRLIESPPPAKISGNVDGNQVTNPSYDMDE